MSDITIGYKGNTIGTMDASGTKTLQTSGKYCEDDIEIAYVKPSGGGSYIGGTVAWNQLVPNANATFTSDNTDTRALNFYFRQDVSPYTSLYNKSNVQTGILSSIVSASFDGYIQMTHVGAVRNMYYVPRQTISVQNGHKYLFSINITGTDVSIVGGVTAKDIQIFDLTAMFGSTIADYAYTLESGTAGAGIAWLKANGFFNSAYYAYDAGTLKSIESYSHFAKSNNADIIGNFGMNFDLELRGIPKLDANNVLYYDGDEYDGNGTVTRKYGIVDLGTLNWQKTSGKNNLFNTKLSLSTAAYGGSNNAVCKAACAKYVSASITNTYTNEADKTVSFTVTGYCYIEDSAYTDADTFKTAMSGVYLVYELATPTYVKPSSTVAPTNLITNGDFSVTGATTNGWSAVNPRRSTIEVSNNKLVLTHTATNNNSYGVSYAVNTTSGHTYYIKFKVTKTLDNTDGDGRGIDIKFGSTVVRRIPNLVQDQVVESICAFTASEDNTSLQITFMGNIGSTAANESMLEVWYIELYDITTIVADW